MSIGIICKVYGANVWPKGRWGWIYSIARPLTVANTSARMMYHRKIPHASSPRPNISLHCARRLYRLFSTLRFMHTFLYHSISFFRLFHHFNAAVYRSQLSRRQQSVSLRVYCVTLSTSRWKLLSKCQHIKCRSAQRTLQLIFIPFNPI